MGQHRTNPAALAAARGELKKSDRARRVGEPGGTMRSVLDIRIEGQATYLQVGSSIRRRFPRVKGKAAVKAAKKTRIVARESAARFSNAA